MPRLTLFAVAHSIPIELRHQQDDTYNQTVWVTEMAALQPQSMARIG